jgi:hypothetical protein
VKEDFFVRGGDRVGIYFMETVQVKGLKVILAMCGLGLFLL